MENGIRNTGSAARRAGQVRAEGDWVAVSRQAASGDHFSIINLDQKLLLQYPALLAFRYINHEVHQVPDFVGLQRVLGHVAAGDAAVDAGVNRFRRSTATESGNGQVSRPDNGAPTVPLK